MGVIKRFFCVLLLFMGLIMRSGEVLAGIKDSPHDVAFWYGADTVGGVIRAGICAYCHVPHSSKGDRLFPLFTSAQVVSYGDVGGLCAKCHQAALYGDAGAVVDEQIFVTLDNDTARAESKMDSHPVKGTRSGVQPKSLQNTDLGYVYNTCNWPWTSTWAAGKGTADIQCSTCHNPHAWNVNAYGSSAVGLAQRKFLRVPVYDSGGPTGRANFCSYCHSNREMMGRNNPRGTHPVSAIGGFASFTNCTTGSYYQDTVWLIRGFIDSASLGATGHKGGRAVFDSAGSSGRFIGARAYETSKIICQTCHMAHGVMHSNDDVYSENDTVELRVGPLLVINNTTNPTRLDSAHSHGPKVAQYNSALVTETAYSLSGTHEENLLCEWCHRMTPDLETNANDTAAFSHPVNKYPHSTADNMPWESTEFGPLAIRYPETTWLKYRESGGIRKAGKSSTYNSDLVGTRGTSYYLICLSCHEPHSADTTNGYLLKKGSGTNKSFCDDCHSDVAMGSGNTADVYFTTWTTHPSGTNARLQTQDGGRSSSYQLPNRAGLKVFDTTNGGYVSCWTCHKGHKGVAKPVLADYQEQFSQMCVNCHCAGGTVATPRVVTPGPSRDADWAYGTAGGETDANPSRYYKEGAWPGWWTNKTSGAPAAYGIGDSTRMGSHYIGQFMGGRPTITSSTKGWLGERAEDRGDGKYLTAVVHYDTSTSESDKWLETTRFVEYVWSTAAYGSGQKTHIGKIGSNLVLICQSCHAVHNSAKGVADDSTVSRLLLGSNYDSYMCRRCHIPEPTVEGKPTKSHPMSVPIYATAFVYNTTVTRTGNAAVNTGTSLYAYQYNAVYNDSTVRAPANYPIWTASERRMTCDACHTVHNAQLRMGAMVLEGTDSAAARTSSAKPNKVPKLGERDDKPTCNLCHEQGK